MILKLKIELPRLLSKTADIVIIGSGMGGATIASALAPSGCSITILERGQRLTDSPETRSDLAIFRDGKFRPDELWLDSGNQPFNPGNFYYVGGNSKFYGAVHFRLRQQDFEETHHYEGVSPAWPVKYQTFEPWYQKAEEMFMVHGDAGHDPTEPAHSGNYPFAPVKDEQSIVNVRDKLREAGVTPASLPLAVNVEAWIKKSRIPWDGFPDTTGAKYDAENTTLANALKHDNVQLKTGCLVNRLVANKSGKITSVEYNHNGVAERLAANTVVLSAGAINSAALLLQSASDAYPNGLANSSDMVGRNFMNHNCSAIISWHPFRRNTAVYQKTLYFNDFYLSGGPEKKPLGNVQLLGKISGNILASQSRLPLWLASHIANHSVDWYAMSEDLPEPENRVTVNNGQITLRWKKTNWKAHQELVSTTKRILKKCGFPIVLSQAFDKRTPSHQCGTLRFGNDPANSVLNQYCRAHDHENLYAVDAGFMPSSAAVNPALTIAAQALRVGDHIRQDVLHS